MKVLIIHNACGSASPSGENTAVAAEKRLLAVNGQTVLEVTRMSDDARAMTNTQLASLALSVSWSRVAFEEVRRDPWVKTGSRAHSEHVSFVLSVSFPRGVLMRCSDSAHSTLPDLLRGGNSSAEWSLHFSYESLSRPRVRPLSASPTANGFQPSGRGRLGGSK